MLFEYLMFVKSFMELHPGSMIVSEQEWFHDNPHTTIYATI